MGGWLQDMNPCHVNSKHGAHIQKKAYTIHGQKDGNILHVFNAEDTAEDMPKT